MRPETFGPYCVSRSWITRRVPCVGGTAYTQFLCQSRVSQMELQSSLCFLMFFPVVPINTDSFISWWSSLLIKFSCFRAISALYCCVQCFHSANILIFKTWIFPRVLCFFRLVIVFWIRSHFFPTAPLSCRAPKLCIQAFIPVLLLWLDVRNCAISLFLEFCLYSVVSSDSAVI